MRRAFYFLVAAAVGYLAMAIHMGTSSGDRAFTLSVLAEGVAVDLSAGGTVCQRRIDVPDTGGFSEISVIPGTHALPGPGLTAIVYNDERVIARGELAAGYPDLREPDIRKRIAVAPVVLGNQTIDICFTNVGPGAVALFGGGFAAPPRTYSEFHGRSLPRDLDLVFYCGCDRSKLDAFVDRLRNASLFKFAGVGLWLGIFWTIAVLVGLPLLMWFALSPRSRGRTAAGYGSDDDVGADPRTQPPLSRPG